LDLENIEETSLDNSTWGIYTLQFIFNPIYKELNKLSVKKAFLCLQQKTQKTQKTQKLRDVEKNIHEYRTQRYIIK